MGNVIDLTGKDDLEAWRLLLVHMVYPDDQLKRIMLTSWIDTLIDHGDLLNKIQELMPAAKISANYGVENDLEKAAYEGCNAGNVLLVFLEMRGKGFTKFTLTDAICVVSKAIQKKMDGTQNEIRASYDTVRDHFRKYNDVAHLWGAFLMMLRGDSSYGILMGGKDISFKRSYYDYPAHERVILQMIGKCVKSSKDKIEFFHGFNGIHSIDYRKFPSIAVSLQKYSKKFLRERRQKPDLYILPSSSLKIIGVPEVSLIFPIIPDHYAKYCADFIKAQNK